MAAAIKNILIEQGATFEWGLRLLDGTGANAPAMDLSGLLLRMHIRSEVDSPVILVSLSTAAGGGITILPQTGLTLGWLEIVIEAAATAALAFEAAVYDLELVQTNGRVIRVVQGAVSLSREVTRL